MIVVDNGSAPRDRTRTRRRAGGRAPGAAPRPPPSHARARGRPQRRLALARGALVAFTDDDCRPTPDWLEAMARGVAEHPGAVLQGPTRPTRPSATATGGRPTRCASSAWARSTRRATSSIRAPCSSALDGFDEASGCAPPARTPTWPGGPSSPAPAPRSPRPPWCCTRSSAWGARASGDRRALGARSKGAGRTSRLAHDALPGPVLERLALPPVALAARQRRDRAGCAASCWPAT